jgi:hypothetical protein
MVILYSVCFVGGDLMNKKTLFITLTLIAIIAGAASASALVSWSQHISWNYAAANKSFTVVGSTTVDYGNITGPTVKTETYTVTNNGNVPVTVNSAAIITGSGITATFDKASVTLSVGAVTTFTLSLTIAGVGSCVASFTAAA